MNQVIIRWTIIGVMLLVIVGVSAAIWESGNRPANAALDQFVQPDPTFHPTEIVNIVIEPQDLLPQLIVTPVATTDESFPGESNDPAYDICMDAWDAESSLSVPEWLVTPLNHEDLQTRIPYTYLGGKLIQNGVVDASSCPNRGLLSNGSASACGMTKAMSAVIEWQNRFDQHIIKASRDNYIPAQLLKRLLAQETQFWPGRSQQPDSFGLGHVTPLGLDPLFKLYPDFYRSICQNVFPSSTCAISYYDLERPNQAILRGYVLKNILDAECPTCTYGIDIDKTINSIDFFAKLLVANCHQVDWIVSDLAKGDSPANHASYEDLWKFTLANYNAGSGCVIVAMADVWTNKPGELNWENFSSSLNAGCAGARLYVNNITK